jgi:hypothetical protein
VPPPRRADGANAFSHPRLVLQGSASLLIKQKLAAQGNIEETSGRLADATNWDTLSGTGLVPCSRSS